MSERISGHMASDFPWEGITAAETSYDLPKGKRLETRTLRVGPGVGFGRLVTDFRFVEKPEASTALIEGEVVDEKDKEEK